MHTRKLNQNWWLGLLLFVGLNAFGQEPLNLRPNRAELLQPLPTPQFARLFLGSDESIWPGYFESVLAEGPPDWPATWPAKWTSLVRVERENCRWLGAIDQRLASYRYDAGEARFVPKSSLLQSLSLRALTELEGLARVCIDRISFEDSVEETAEEMSKLNYGKDDIADLRFAYQLIERIHREVLRRGVTMLLEERRSLIEYNQRLQAELTTRDPLEAALHQQLEIFLGSSYSPAPGLLEQQGQDYWRELKQQEEARQRRIVEGFQRFQLQYSLDKIGTELRLQRLGQPLTYENLLRMWTKPY